LLLDARWVENDVDNSLGSATGFVVSLDGVSMLITNRHVVTGRRQTDGEILSDHGVTPTHLDIRHLRSGALVDWTTRRVPLYENGQPCWTEHPVFGSRADIVALPLSVDGGLQLLPHSLEARPDNQTADLSPTTDVSIVGYPFGRTGSGDLAIWTRGVVASEPALAFEGLPVFLVDSRTRKGQSGSPVIVEQIGGFLMMRTGMSTAIGEHTELVGVYSGRINEESDIGMVWNLRALREVVQAAAEKVEAQRR
jgi:hypothetical protein